MKHFIYGIIIGIANIIPGVSGGTLALVLGIYERFVGALNRLSSPLLLRAALACLTFRRSAWQALWREALAADVLFLARIGAGALVAIVAASRAMAYLLENHHAASYGFFAGLVAVSMVYPLRAVGRRSWRTGLAFVLAALLAAGLNFTVSDQEQIEKAERKLAVGEARAAAGTDAVEERTGFVSMENPGAARLVFVFFAAALALSAMVLPGVSGSFVLLMLGVYFDVLLAVNARQIPLLAVFALGALTGLLCFARIMDLLLKRAHDITMAFMTGLMAGSLYGLWPFKNTAVVGDQMLYLSNRLPGSWSGGEWLVLAMLAAGAGLAGVSLLIETSERE